jgi:hypothetical protein
MLGMVTETKELVAGAELDAMVAEKVMGWVRTPNQYGDYWHDGNHLYVGGGSHNPLPHYSTDIAAAWQVVQHLRKRLMQTPGAEEVDFNVGEEGDPRRPYCTAFIHVRGATIPGGWGQAHEFGNWDASADTAPLAICRAALAAVSGR